MKKKIVLTFPSQTVTKPITYHLVKDYDLVINILRAKIEPEEVGTLVIEIKGSKENYEKALKFLESQKIEVQELAKDIDLNREKCVDCGLCTGICPTKALHLNSDYRIEFNKEKCILCEACVSACPTRAIILHI